MSTFLPNEKPPSVTKHALKPSAIPCNFSWLAAPWCHVTRCSPTKSTYLSFMKMVVNRLPQGSTSGCTSHFQTPRYRKRQRQQAVKCSRKITTAENTSKQLSRTNLPPMSWISQRLQFFEANWPSAQRLKVTLLPLLINLLNTSFNFTMAVNISLRLIYHLAAMILRFQIAAYSVICKISGTSPCSGC